MSVPSPSQSPKSWDEITLGGLHLPGIPDVRVKGSNDVEKKKPKGGTGASTTFQGRNAATVSITLTLHDLIEGTQDWEVLTIVLPVLFPAEADKENGAAFAIEHPMTSLFGIKAVKIETIEAEKKGRDVIVKIEATQFLPPKKGAAGSATKTETTLDPRNQSLAADLPERPSRPDANP